MAPISYKALKILASRYCPYFGTVKLLLFNHRKQPTYSGGKSHVSCVMYIDFPLCSVVRTCENEQWWWSPWKEEMVIVYRNIGFSIKYCFSQGNKNFINIKFSMANMEM
jgi:hypothetical protein